MFGTEVPNDIIAIDVSSADQALAQEVYALRATGAGNISLLTRAGNTVTMAFAAGETRPIYTMNIFKTSTTATGVEGFISANAQQNPNSVVTDADPSGVTVLKGSPNMPTNTDNDGADSPGADDTAP